MICDLWSGRIWLLILICLCGFQLSHCFFVDYTGEFSSYYKGNFNFEDIYIGTCIFSFRSSFCYYTFPLSFVKIFRRLIAISGSTTLDKILSIWLSMTQKKVNIAIALIEWFGIFVISFLPAQRTQS